MEASGLLIDQARRLELFALDNRPDAAFFAALHRALLAAGLDVSVSALRAAASSWLQANGEPARLDATLLAGQTWAQYVARVRDDDLWGGDELCLVACVHAFASFRVVTVRSGDERASCQSLFPRMLPTDGALVTAFLGLVEHGSRKVWLPLRAREAVRIPAASLWLHCHWHALVAALAAVPNAEHLVSDLCAAADSSEFAHASQVLEWSGAADEDPRKLTALLPQLPLGHRMHLQRAVMQVLGQSPAEYSESPAGRRSAAQEMEAAQDLREVLKLHQFPHGTLESTTLALNARLSALLGHFSLVQTFPCLASLLQRVGLAVDRARFGFTLDHAQLSEMERLLCGLVSCAPAFAAQSLPVVEEFLREFPAFINLVGPNDLTLLGAAVEKGDEAIVAFLLIQPNMMNVDERDWTPNRDTALIHAARHAAAGNAWTRIARALIAAGANMHLARQDGRTAADFYPPLLMMTDVAVETAWEHRPMDAELWTRFTLAHSLALDRALEDRTAVSLLYVQNQWMRVDMMQWVTLPLFGEATEYIRCTKRPPAGCACEWQMLVGKEQRWTKLYPAQTDALRVALASGHALAMFEDGAVQWTVHVKTLMCSSSTGEQHASLRWRPIQEKRAGRKVISVTPSMLDEEEGDFGDAGWPEPLGPYIVEQDDSVEPDQPPEDASSESPAAPTVGEEALRDLSPPDATEAPEQLDDVVVLLHSSPILRDFLLVKGEGVISQHLSQFGPLPALRFRLGTTGSHSGELSLSFQGTGWQRVQAQQMAVRLSNLLDFLPKGLAFFERSLGLEVARQCSELRRFKPLVELSTAWTIFADCVAALGAASAQRLVQDAQRTLYDQVIRLLPDATQHTNDWHHQASRFVTDIAADGVRELAAGLSSARVDAMRQTVQTLIAGAKSLSSDNDHALRVLLQHAERGAVDLHHLSSVNAALRRVTLLISAHDQELPLFRNVPLLLEKFERARVLVVDTSTGSGKSTLVPSILLARLPDCTRPGVRIAITQPRRLPCESVSQRVGATFSAGGVNNSISQWRYAGKQGDEPSHARNPLLYLTDGLLLEQLMRVTPESPIPYDVIMLDEVHERSANIDLCIAILAKGMQNDSFPGLRVILSTATLDPAVVAPFVKTLGSQAVETFYLKHASPFVGYPDVFRPGEHAVEVVRELAGTLKRDEQLLCFLPSKGDVRRALEAFGEGRAVGLHAGQPAAKQAKLLDEAQIFFATNIAETSLTIKELRYVVDSGRAMLPDYDPMHGLVKLLEGNASASSITQRKGRLNRRRRGTYVALYAPKDERPAYHSPAMHTVSLLDTELRLRRAGQSLDKLHATLPLELDRELLIEVNTRMRMLGLLDNNGHETAMLKLLRFFPECGGARMACAVLAALSRFQCGGDMISLAAVLLVLRNEATVALSSLPADVTKSHENGDLWSFILQFRKMAALRQVHHGAVTLEALRVPAGKKWDRILSKYDTLTAQLAHVGYSVHARSKTWKNVALALSHGYPDHIFVSQVRVKDRVWGFRLTLIVSCLWREASLRPAGSGGWRPRSQYGHARRSARHQLDAGARHQGRPRCVHFRAHAHADATHGGRYCHVERSGLF